MTKKRRASRKDDGRTAAKFRCPLCQRLGPCKSLGTINHVKGSYLKRRRVCPCARRLIFTTYEFTQEYSKHLMNLDHHIRKYIQKVHGLDIKDVPFEEAAKREVTDLIGNECVDVTRVKMEVKYGGEDPGEEFKETERKPFFAKKKEEEKDTEDEEVPLEDLRGVDPTDPPW